MSTKVKSSWDGFSLSPKLEMPEGVWMQCELCKSTLYRKAVKTNMNICPDCGAHFRVDADTRIEQIADEGSFQEIAADLVSSDPLDFKYSGTTYRSRLDADAAKKGVREGIKIGRAFIKGRGVMLGVMDSSFLMGSMGEVVGAKFCMAVDIAIEEKLPQAECIIPAVISYIGMYEKANFSNR